MELKVGEAISRQVELWKKNDNYYQTAIPAEDVNKTNGIDNYFINMTREIVFGNMVYI